MSTAVAARVERAERRCDDLDGGDGAERRCRMREEYGDGVRTAAPAPCWAMRALCRWGGIEAHDTVQTGALSTSWKFTDQARRAVRWNGERSRVCSACPLTPGVVLPVPDWAHPEWLELGALIDRSRPGPARPLHNHAPCGAGVTAPARLQGP